MRPAWAFVFAIGCVVVSAAPQTPRAPQSAFRGGVELVQLDVTVLDRDRRPVRGLSASDFVIIENGQPQPILAFAPVDVPDPIDPPARWMRETAADVVSNDLETRRLVVIVMDDAYTRFDPAVSRFAKQIAGSVIDGLGPDDLAAVAYTFQGRTQTFTSDPAQLRRAVDAFVPKNMVGFGPPTACEVKEIVGGCLVDLLSHLADALRSAPPGRKIVVYIGGGGLPALTDPGTMNQLEPVDRMFRGLQATNAAVYAFDPNGLLGGGPTAADGSAAVAKSRIEAQTTAQDGLHILADNTGGRVYTATNTPWAHVPEVFHENSSYYLLGFRPADARRDGRFRPVEVRVNRPDVEVRTRRGYFRPTDDKPSTRAAAAPLDTAIARSLPSGDLPLTIATAAFAVPGRRNPELSIVAGFRDDIGAQSGPTIAAEVRRVSLIATAFDADWKSRGAATKTFEIGINSGAEGALHYEALSRLPLAPGRYEIRLAAESAGRTGSVFVDVDVPDFAREALSLSGFVLERRPAAHVASGDALADLIPLVPTTVRSFRQSDQAVVFFRAYQGGTSQVRPVHVTTRVVDEADRAVLDLSTDLAADRFGARRAADLRAELPLATLDAGEYVLTVTATLDATRVRRDLRFTVR